MNNSDYNAEIKSIAAYLVSDAMEQCDNDRDDAEELINDSLLHETIDGHQWVIYYSYNLDVIQNSDNSEAYKDVYDNESIGALVSEKGVDDLNTMIAFFAMYQDVQDCIKDAFEAVEAS
jgi:hypothetical protein